MPILRKLLFLLLIVATGVGFKLKSDTKLVRNDTEIIDPHDNYFKDIIYFKDGSELVVNIKTLRDNSITFEQYDNKDLFAIDTSEVKMVKLKNGTVKDFTKTKASNVSNSSKNKTTSSASKRSTSKKKRK